MNILITTLGKGSRNKDDGYQETKYQFDDKTSLSTPFIGFALLKLVPQIDKLIVLGTAGSIWDAWWQVLPNVTDKDGDIFDGLTKIVKEETKNDSLLEKLSCILSRELKICVECKYIPDSLDESSQLDILNIVNKIGNKGDQLYLDVTHGFRHLPMLELLSAFLKKKDVKIGNIFYGAFEKKDKETNVTPIISLTGLLRLEEWIEAMAILRQTGDVIPLAEIDTMNAFRNDLEQYYFFVQMNNIGQARGFANRILGLINKGELPKEGVLFKDELESIFSWARNQEYAKRQLDQAKEALKRRNILRAIILLNEATISAWIPENNQILDVEMRKNAEDKLYHNGGDTWHLLRHLRNSTAHDGQLNGKFEKKIKKLRKSLDEFNKGITEIVKWVEEQVNKV